MAVEYSGRTSAYEHKHSFDPAEPLDPSTKQGLRKVWFLDAQWSTCPIEVEQEVKKLWRDYDCGNDHYIVKTSVADLLDMEGYDAIVQYIREHSIPDDEQVIIHWWW